MAERAADARAGLIYGEAWHMTTLRQLLEHAAGLHRIGRLAEAENLCRAILQEIPRQPHALHLLGVLALQAGRAGDAIDWIRQALTVSPDEPAFHTNLSAAYLAADRLPEAAEAARSAVRLKPGLADAHNNLGVALRRQGLLAEAEPVFRAALNLQPGHVDARVNLGAVLQERGQLAESLQHLEEAVRLAPTNAHAHNDLAGALISAHQSDRALEHAQKALYLAPNLPEVHNNTGTALRGLGWVEQAGRHFDTAKSLKHAHVKARINLGQALLAMGKVEEGLAEFHEALRFDPSNARALALLSNLAAHDRYELSAEEAESIRQLAGRADVPAEDLCHLHFALARMFDKAGNYDEAFSHCRRGNELRKEFERGRGVVFDAAAHRRQIDELIAAYSPEYFRSSGGFGIDSDLPVFVVGMMRSGTTLVEQILASHPRVYGAGELGELGRLGNALPPANAQSAGSWSAAYVEHLRQRALKESAQPVIRVVDKTPSNFLRLGLIATLFPRARIIHCRRDPADTCFSCYYQCFSEPHPFTLDLRDLGRYYGEYARLMARWHSVLPVPILDVQYEDLIADQESVTRRLVDFCGLAWDERCLRFHETSRPVQTASMLQVRRPMYGSSVGRWKLYAAHLQPLLEELAFVNGLRRT